MPDVSIRLSEGRLSLQEAYEAVRGPGFGGIALFCGDVRAREAGRPIEAIVYEAYVPMALKELDRVAALAAGRHGARVAVIHRLGRVPAGETSVVVAAAAAHRPEAFKACREVIDGLKESVPIWKASFEEALPPLAAKR